jgi:hypothetical protein
MQQTGVAVAIYMSGQFVSFLLSCGGWALLLWSGPCCFAKKLMGVGGAPGFHQKSFVPPGGPTFWIGSSGTEFAAGLLVPPWMSRYRVKR